MQMTTVQPLLESLPLPAAIGVERKQQQLSKQARMQIARLNGPRPGRFMREVVKVWVIVALTILIAVWAHNPLVTVLAIVIIGGRQNALGLLMHEQAHYLGLRSRWGDLIVNLLVCYPLLFVNVAGYARIHLAHHRFFFTEKDPDIARKSGRDWTFPMSRPRLAGLFVRHLAGLAIVTTIIGKNPNHDLPKLRRLGPSPAWNQALFVIALAVLLTAIHGWRLFLIYWLLPLVTVLQAMVLLGAICEHVYTRAATLETSTAIIIPRWWERLLFHDFNFFYHVYHHYFPGVSFAHLPAIHEIYRSEGLLHETRVFHGIYRYLGHLTSPPATWSAGTPAVFCESAEPV